MRSRIHRKSVNLLVAAWIGLVSLVGCEGSPPPGPEDAPLTARSASELTQSQVLPVGPTCTSTGAHAKHEFTDCLSCHVCGGVLQFDPAGPAIAPNMPPPVFDATTKTCSNAACHGMDAGTFTYSFPGGDGEPVLNTVSYGGTIRNTPSWYAAPPTCSACHGNPPTGYTWHSGRHGNQLPTGLLNQCQLCHPDAISTDGVATGLSLATNCGPGGTYGSCAALHRNGRVEVTASFKSTCMNCH